MNSHFAVELLEIYGYLFSFQAGETGKECNGSI
jgi:hypothetical protein